MVSSPRVKARGPIEAAGPQTPPPLTIRVTVTRHGAAVVRALSHEAAARLFEGHPHFTIFLATPWT